MATGGAEDDRQLVSALQKLSVRSPELTVHCQTDRRKSELMATIKWTYGNRRTRVDSWKLCVRNLTWEQNDFDYDKKTFKCEGDVNEYRLPLWFQSGNRYKVTVYGRQHNEDHTEVVCRKSIEFRTGERQ